MSPRERVQCGGASSGAGSPVHPLHGHLANRSAEQGQQVRGQFFVRYADAGHRAFPRTLFCDRRNSASGTAFAAHTVMPPSLLSQVRNGGHVCQFYSDSAPLAAAVAVFAGSGLEQGEPVLLIATPENTVRFEAALRRTHPSLDTVKEKGQLVTLDAAATLEQFMGADGMPDWPRFKSQVGGVLGRMAARGKGTIRAYGEMVNLLWQDGHAEAAIKLEEFWNDLLPLYPATLFCAYQVDPLAWASYEGPLHDIGRTHTDVLATQEDERLRAAVEAATDALLGTTISRMLSYSGCEQARGEHRLPTARRTLLWLHRNMPSSSIGLLEDMRRYLDAHPELEQG
jgi:prepilin-type processing-associated H-X9-DG protein